MSGWLRKLRGVVGIGLTWGVLWGMAAAALSAIVGAVDPARAGPGLGPMRVAVIIGFAGFVSGVGFGLLLSLAERRRILRELSLGRAALWGTLGAAAIPLLTGAGYGMLFFTCPLGLAFAVGSVALARRAELRDGGRSPLHLPAPR